MGDGPEYGDMCRYGLDRSVLPHNITRSRIYPESQGNSSKQHRKSWEFATCRKCRLRREKRLKYAVCEDHRNTDGERRTATNEHAEADPAAPDGLCTRASTEFLPIKRGGGLQGGVDLCGVLAPRLGQVGPASASASHHFGRFADAVAGFDALLDQVFRDGGQ